jgi:hypothetical protein
MLEPCFGTIDDQFRRKCRLNTDRDAEWFACSTWNTVRSEVGKLFNQSFALRLFRVTIREFSHNSPPDVSNGSYSKGNDGVRSTRWQSRFLLTNMVPGRTSCLSGGQLSEKHADVP